MDRCARRRRRHDPRTARHAPGEVRYIGIDAPELHHPTRGEEPGGREATELNRRLVGSQHVRLELDVRARDQYGRLLAYVWVGDLMVNAELVRLGYAQVMTVPPNVKHQALLVKLPREARDVGRGLWRGVRLEERPWPPASSREATGTPHTSS